jgi:hypothetical protein
MLVLVAVVVLYALYVRQRGETKQEEPALDEAPDPKSAVSHAVPVQPQKDPNIEAALQAEAPKVASVDVEIIEAVEKEPQHQALLRFEADQVVALVNGVAIRGRDVAPPGHPERGGTEKKMESEDFAKRLNQAIEREVTFQAAHLRGVELTETQQQQVEGMREQREAEIARYQDQGIMWTTLTDEQIEFQMRHASALLLQQNLLTTNAPDLLPSGVSAEDVDAYYQQNKETYGELASDPAERDETAWQNVQAEIRNELKRQNRETYNAQRAELLRGLKDQAEIEVLLSAENI